MFRFPIKFKLSSGRLRCRSLHNVTILGLPLTAGRSFLVAPKRYVPLSLAWESGPGRRCTLCSRLNSLLTNFIRGGDGWFFVTCFFFDDSFGWSGLISIEDTQLRFYYDKTQATQAIHLTSFRQGGLDPGSDTIPDNFENATFVPIP